MILISHSAQMLKRYTENSNDYNHLYMRSSMKNLYFFKTEISIIIIALTLCILHCSNNSKEDDEYYKIKNPLYSSESVNITKIKSINTIGVGYSISDINDYDADENNNIYILSTRDAEIFVFNKEGKIINSLGGRGQGPKELERPYFFTI